MQADIHLASSAGSLSLEKRHGKHRKKEQGAKPCSEIVSTLNFPENLDLILFDGATLLVRARGSCRDLDHLASTSRPA
jgi:hypothetical protein